MGQKVVLIDAIRQDPDEAILKLQVSVGKGDRSRGARGGGGRYGQPQAAGIPPGFNRWQAVEHLRQP